MFILKRVKAWFFTRRPRPLSELLSVQFDEEQVKVRVLDKLDSTWNQDFSWGDVTRVCFKDEGLYSSDSLIIQLTGRERPVVVPSEARGGSEFFEALIKRGYFPEEVWRRAMGETCGGIHCWPPLESKNV